MQCQEIEKVVVDSGLWKPERRSTHGFLLSPTVYEVTAAQQAELATLAAALRDCLTGLGSIAAEACEPRVSHNHTYGMLTRAVRAGVPRVYHRIMLRRPGSIPTICKVDLIELPDGSYRVAEIDGHNKHGLGYSVLSAQLRDKIKPGGQGFPGVAASIAQDVHERGAHSLILLYGEQERFYLPEFQILQDALRRYDVDLFVISENDLGPEQLQELLSHNPQPALFIDLPFLFRNSRLKNRLVGLYENGEVDFLIPPKPFLGSKSMLALIRNDLGNQELETILESHIPSYALNVARDHIPETWLVRKGMKPDDWRRLWNYKKRFLLKACVSSGMKGVIFADSQRFANALAGASQSDCQSVIQEELENEPRRLPYFTEQGELREDDWYLRVTAHITARGIADLAITARRDKKVHGSPDCLKIGAVKLP